MGAWQLAAAASVLGTPIMSIYPEYGAATVRGDLHRLFWPREASASVVPVKIMWTNVLGIRLKPNMW